MRKGFVAERDHNKLRKYTLQSVTDVKPCEHFWRCEWPRANNYNTVVRGMLWVVSQVLLLLFPQL